MQPVARRNYGALAVGENLGHPAGGNRFSVRGKFHARPALKSGKSERHTVEKRHFRRTKPSLSVGLKRR